MKPQWQTKIAKERIEILFNEARKMVKEDQKLAKRYVKLACKIGMRYNVRLGLFKRNYCKYCHSFLLPGFNSKQRLKNGILHITCMQCNKIRRIPYREHARTCSGSRLPKKILGRPYK